MAWNGRLSRISIESVLHFMNPNQRINVSVDSPTVRYIGTGVPLRYANVEVMHSSLNVNGTSYKMGIVRIYTDYEGPVYFRNERNAGGAPHDVGQHANPNCYRNGIRNQHSEAPSIYLGAEIHEAELKLKEIVDYLNEFKKYPVLRSSDQKAVAAKEEEAAKLRKKIIKYNEKKANSELKYEEFIMLTQTGENGEQVRTEYVKYDKPLKDAWRYFLDHYVLGFKLRGPVIERLSVSHPQPQLIFQESRLSSRNLVLNSTGTQTLDNAMNLLKEECIPLNSVEICGPDDLNHHLLATARTLIIADSRSASFPRTFRNDVVCFKQIRRPSRVMSRSIDFWRLHGLPQRKQYIFETIIRSDAKLLLGTFREYHRRRYKVNFHRNNFPIQFQYQLRSDVRLMRIQVTVDRVVTENPDVYNYVIEMTAIPE
ncbi:hypothetical protein CRE_31247 [Caenorhabditis remanei]|uniref:Uncharacterized protein n=1 Tax=Caenorhabditis remanei TaxID=31234 RepID=E3MLT7_CAERE|nr:hypothetical protein CRE_31247 [Caenorhabditis remanei]